MESIGPSAGHQPVRWNRAVGQQYDGIRPVATDSGPDRGRLRRTEFRSRLVESNGSVCMPVNLDNRVHLGGRSGLAMPGTVSRAAGPDRPPGVMALSMRRDAAGEVHPGGWARIVEGDVRSRSDPRDGRRSPATSPQPGDPSALGTPTRMPESGLPRRVDTSCARCRTANRGSRRPAHRDRRRDDRSSAAPAHAHPVSSGPAGSRKGAEIRQVAPRYDAVRCRQPWCRGGSAVVVLETASVVGAADPAAVWSSRFGAARGAGRRRRTRRPQQTPRRPRALLRLFVVECAMIVDGYARVAFAALTGRSIAPMCDLERSVAPTGRAAYPWCRHAHPPRVPFSA